MAADPQPPTSSPPRSKRSSRRLLGGLPLVVTVLVHLLLAGFAAAVVVQQQNAEKRKVFEAGANVESTSAKQVEHRLQVARRGGASGGASSPVSVNRITVAAQGALALPEMPDLPSVGAGGFGGFSSLGGGIGVDSGSGMATSLGSGSGMGGKGFMSLSFLGSSSMSASRIVFIVDTSSGIMDLRKGGFRAFTIIREEILRLVAALPPGAKFNVILYAGRNDGSNAFAAELVDATSDRKKEFFAWMAPVNTDVNRLGPRSAPKFTRIPLKEPPSGIVFNPQLEFPAWEAPLRLALQSQPDIVYLITSTLGSVRKKVSEEELRTRRAAAEKRRAELVAKGIDVNAIASARNQAYGKARREFDEANRKLVAAGKDPIVITHNTQIFSPHVQAALRRNGITITLDRSGWGDLPGADDNFNLSVSDDENAPWTDFYAHVSRLQSAFTPERARLNLFYFVGPNYKSDEAADVLATLAKRNGGGFALLTTKRLEELKAAAAKER